MAELTPEQLAVFGPPNLAYLATINEDGSPHLSPLWADTRDGMIVLNTADGRVKVENVRRDPRVSVAIHDKEHPHPPIAVVGTVVDITTAGAARALIVPPSASTFANALNPVLANTGPRSTSSKP